MRSSSAAWSITRIAVMVVGARAHQDSTRKAFPIAHGIGSTTRAGPSFEEMVGSQFHPEMTRPERTMESP